MVIREQAPQATTQDRDVHLAPCGAGCAFVAGATGYTGQALVAELLRRSIRTVAHVRPGSSMPAPDDAAICACAWTDKALRAAMQRHQPTWVFCVVGTTRKRLRQDPKASYLAVDFGLTAMLLEAARTCAVAPRFVYLSALGARTGSPFPYLHARGLAEDSVRASSLPWTIVQASLISGDRAEHRPAEAVSSQAMRILTRGARQLGLGTLAARYAPMRAATLARALVSMAVDPAFVGRVVRGEDFPR